MFVFNDKMYKHILYCDCNLMCITVTDNNNSLYYYKVSSHVNCNCSYCDDYCYYNVKE
jgi:hypothetical protein